MKSDIPTLIICAVFIIAGILSAVAALMNWDWFFTSSNAKLLIGKFSRLTARIIYFILGCLIVTMGVFVFIESERMLR